MFANVHCHHLHREENVLGSREGKSGDLSSDNLPYVKDKVKFEFEMFCIRMIYLIELKHLLEDYTKGHSTKAGSMLEGCGDQL